MRDGIRLMHVGDEEAMAALLRRDPFYNLFMLGDLETMWPDAPELWYWGSYRDGALVGLLMCYRVYWCLYDDGGADLAGFARLVDERGNAVAFNGRDTLIDRFLPLLRNYEVVDNHHTYYCRLSAVTSGLETPHTVRRVTEADIPVLTTLYRHAGIMARDADGFREMLATGRMFVTEVDGQIVSGAMSTAEASDMAMIGGVWTPEPLRKRGYASAAMLALCRDLLAEGKTPCLFYDNPDAGRIYRRLGFEDIGRWRMVFVKRRRM